MLTVVDVTGQVLRDVAVEEHPQDILLEIPAVHAAAQIVGYIPDGAVQLSPFLFFNAVRHNQSPQSEVARRRFCNTADPGIVSTRTPSLPGISDMAPPKKLPGCHNPMDTLYIYLTAAGDVPAGQI